MPRYISLLNWTDQGLRNVKDTVNRAHAGRQAFQAGGGQLLEVYWTLGGFDQGASLNDVVRASASIPSCFRPFRSSAGTAVLAD